MTHCASMPWLAPLLLAGILCGCATSPPSKFYLLTPLSGAEAPHSAASRASHPALGIGPIKLPAYLDRSEIVTRSGSNSLKVADFDRWGEPVSDNFMRVLALNLAMLVNTNQISVSPWPRYAPIDYQVVVEADRFDVGTDDKAVLVARWYILSGGEEGKVLRSGSTVITEPAGTDEYADVAAAMSRAVAQLAREIAANLKGLPVRPAVTNPA